MDNSGVNGVMLVGSLIGLVIGGYLGLVTERGSIGLITVLGAVLGAAIGTYAAQMIAGARPDDE